MGRWRFTRERRALVALMRGYRTLRAKGEGHRIPRLREALTALPLVSARDKISPLIFGAATPHAEHAVRQVVLLRFGSDVLGRALLQAAATGSPARAAVPRSWRATFAEHGFRIAPFAGLRFQLAVFRLFAAGLVEIASQVTAGLREATRPINGRHVTFVDVSAANLPRRKESRDLISWYLQWSGRQPALTAIHHGVPDMPDTVRDGVRICRGDGAPPSLDGAAAVVRLLGWAVLAVPLCVFHLLRGRWWHALMLRDACRARVLRLQPQGRLAVEYLFGNSAWYLRPLWTYEAEAAGAAVTMYFYSTNCEGFQSSGSPPSLGFGWAAMNWPRYLVWDEGQADFVRRAVGGQAPVEIVGPIWFQDGPTEVPSLPPRAIGVFDVTPYRRSFYEALALESDFYRGETATRFLQDLHAVAGALEATVVWKQKRRMGPFVHRGYRLATERLAASPRVLSVDPEISAERLIPRVQCVVSLPFTSTALIARARDVPSCYYDPLGELEAGDPAAHGVPIVRGRDQLERWLRAALPTPATVRDAS